MSVERATHAFHTHYRGFFTSMLRWPQLEALWATIQAQPEGWYIYFVGKTVPQAPVNTAELTQFIVEMDALLRREHDYDYCGIVYADDPKAPTMVKIFDPNHLGAVCGTSGQVVTPGWILSRIPPTSIEGHSVVAENRKRWWQHLFAQ
ncbi:MAG: hypothetical protein SVR94_06930 [Pseudomonadota bacterium]|nr:hypothetical protein [Pseudomonadota bacterium]